MYVCMYVCVCVCVCVVGDGITFWSSQEVDPKGIECQDEVSQIGQQNLRCKGDR